MTKCDASDISGDFLRFHKDNPHVYRALEKLLIEWRSRTDKPVGMSLLYSRARWELALETHDSDYKLNSNYSPFYARLLMKNHQELKGVFRTRTSLADGIDYDEIPLGVAA